MPNFLVDENAVFIVFLAISVCYLLPKMRDNCAIIMMSQNVTRFATRYFYIAKIGLTVESSTSEHIAGGPRKASYGNTSYTPKTYMNIYAKAPGIRML